MKKILLACLIGAASLATLSSCTKEYITNTLPGVSYTINAPSSDWVYNGEGIYVNELDFPELDAKYMEFGTVQVAVELPHTQGTYDVIPVTIDNVHYSVNYSIGKVTLFAENRNEVPRAPGNMKVKVTLRDADNGGN